MSDLVLYSRPGCPECDRVRLELQAAGITFDDVDVSEDVSLEAEHGKFVPVIEAGGRIIFHTGMDVAELIEETIPNL